MGEQFFVHYTVTHQNGDKVDMHYCVAGPYDQDAVLTHIMALRKCNGVSEAFVSMIPRREAQ